MSTITTTSTNNTNSTKTATYFTLDHINKKIVGSEFNFKMAGNPSKDQYAALMAVMNLHPSYTLTPVASKKKVEKKQSYEGLTMNLMEEYLNIYEGELADVARAKFAEMKKLKEEKKMSYSTIKSWFLELFPKSKQLNVSELARVCDISRTTVYKYIGLLEG